MADHDVAGFGRADNAREVAAGSVLSWETRLDGVWPVIDDDHITVGVVGHLNFDYKISQLRIKFIMDPRAHKVFCFTLGMIGVSYCL